MGRKSFRKSLLDHLSKFVRKALPDYKGTIYPFLGMTRDQVIEFYARSARTQKLKLIEYGDTWTLRPKSKLQDCDSVESFLSLENLTVHPYYGSRRRSQRTKKSEAIMALERTWEELRQASGVTLEKHVEKRR